MFNLGSREETTHTPEFKVVNKYCNYTVCNKRIGPQGHKCNAIVGDRLVTLGCRKCKGTGYYYINHGWVEGINWDRERKQCQYCYGKGSFVGLQLVFKEI